ncbi:MAG TPA: hypothetical protein VG326_05500 [Tepidisphaeraceae bacterium]|jgi:hypothetical protein|nr:hypothetical protein [Tepidisphaeraceae bacterium]
MPHSFFDYLRDLRVDVSQFARRDLGARPNEVVSRELHAQLSRLISTRRTPLPEPDSDDRFAGAASSFSEFDRLITYGFDQPSRIRVTEQKDIEDLKMMVSQCVARHFSNARVDIGHGANARSPRGCTIVPVNVNVRTREMGASLDLRLDRISRDVEVVPDSQ